MAHHIVVGRQFGDSVQFPAEGGDIKQVRQEAKAEARRIFDYKGPGGDAADPSVSLRQVEEKE
jgi:hypothetical protein